MANTPVQLKGGHRDDLPSSLDERDHYLVVEDGNGAVDPPELYVGPQGGGIPVVASPYEGKRYIAYINEQTNVIHIDDYGDISVTDVDPATIKVESSGSDFGDNTSINLTKSKTTDPTLNIQSDGSLNIGVSNVNAFKIFLEVIKYPNA